MAIALVQKKNTLGFKAKELFSSEISLVQKKNSVSIIGIVTTRIVSSFGSPRISGIETVNGPILNPMPTPEVIK